MAGMPKRRLTDWRGRVDALRLPDLPTDEALRVLAHLVAEAIVEAGADRLPEYRRQFRRELNHAIRLTS